MGQRIVPRRKYPPRYYFKRTEHGLERRLLVADENGRYVPAPENPSPTTSSKLSDAERTRLKTVLKKALANVNYTESSFGFGDVPTKPLVVLNVAASKDDFKGDFDRLCDEVLLEDPTLLDISYRRLSLQYLIRQQQQPDRPAWVPPIHEPGKPWTRTQHVLPVHPYAPRVILQPIAITPTPLNLQHPFWYLGFWAKTYVDISAAAYPDNTNYTGVIGSVQIKFGNYADRPELVTALFQISDNLVTISEEIDISGLVTYFGFPLVVVWNADQWVGHYVRDDQLPYNVGLVKEQAYTPNRGTVLANRIVSYFDPTLFDHVSVVLAVHAPFDSCVITNIKIMLNSETILNNPYNISNENGAPPTKVDLSNDISQFRKQTMIYNHPIGPIDNYDPAEIRNNPILKLAASQLGYSWCRKYGSVWNSFTFSRGGKQSTGWQPYPGYWCGHFASWAFWVEGTLRRCVPGYPYLCPDDAGASRITDWFLFTDRYFCPNSKIWIFFDWHNRWYVDNNGNEIANVYNAVRPYNRTDYRELGNLVKPGYYAYCRGHAGLFLYWLDPNHNYGKLNAFHSNGKWDPNQTAQNFLLPLNNAPNADGPPGPFFPDRDVNFFCMISGNLGNVVHARCTVAVINLSQWDPEVIKYLIKQDKNQKKTLIIPWFYPSSDNKDEGRIVDDEEDKHGQLKGEQVITGFGRTDGKSIDIRNLTLPFVTMRPRP